MFERWLLHISGDHAGNHCSTLQWMCCNIKEDANNISVQGCKFGVVTIRCGWVHVDITWDGYMVAFSRTQLIHQPLKLFSLIQSYVVMPLGNFDSKKGRSNFKVVGRHLHRQFLVQTPKLLLIISNDQETIDKAEHCSFLTEKLTSKQVDIYNGSV